MIPDRRCLLSLCMISKIYALLSGPRPSRCLHRFLLQETMWVFSPCVVVVRGVSTEAWHAVLPPRVWATGPSLCNSVTSHFLPLFYPLLVCLSEFLFFQKKINTGYHCARLHSLLLEVHQPSLLDGHAHKCHLKIALKHHLYDRHLFCI